MESWQLMLIKYAIIGVCGAAFWCVLWFCTRQRTDNHPVPENGIMRDREQLSQFAAQMRAAEAQWVKELEERYIMAGGQDWAAERLRIYHSNKLQSLGPKHPYSYQHPAGGWYFDAPLYQRDLAELAAAYLAEHPADDDEPIDDVWLLTLPDATDRREGVFIPLDEDTLDCLQYFRPKTVIDHTYPAMWQLNGSRIWAGKKVTRGDVRRLCKFLGVGITQ